MHHKQRRWLSWADIATAPLRLVRRHRGERTMALRADWPVYGQTLEPLPPDDIVREPRIRPELRTLADKVRDYYDAIELDIAVAVDRAIMRSRENWSLSHA